MLLLLVARTVGSEGDDEVIRIIWARRADRKERKRYEKGASEEPQLAC